VAQFLSPEWQAEARQIREEFQDRAPAIAQAARINQVITDVPFGDGTVHSHMDTTSGQLVMEEGHLENADATVTTDYETARATVLDPASAMQAFMAGKVKVQGDMTKLMMLMQASPDPVSLEIQQRIRAITE
jgi:alkyl sulfatase BDS1-like metallo-beta-lactamase superfamily hydrolase